MFPTASKKTREKFIIEFVKELILIKSYEMESRGLAKKEAERIRLEIEAQKLRQKYLNELREKELRKLEEKRRGVLSRKIELMNSKKYKEKKFPMKEKIKEVIDKPKKVVQGVFAKKPVPRSLPIYRPVQPLRKAPEAQQLNVNKIQIFISDLDIESIECPGKEKNIIIKKRSQTMRTEIKLNEKDIGEIINEFSEKARIPIIEGLLKARVGRLQISAVISDEAGSRFIITRRDVQMLGPGPGMVGPRFPRPIQKPLTPPQNRMQQSNQGLQGMQPSIIHR